MRKTDAFRRAAALLAALSITVSLAAPAFAGTYYIDNGDITITKKDDGSQEIKQNGTIIENDDRGEIVITTYKKAITTLESDLEGPAAEDSGFGPVVEDNYQPAPPAQPEDAEEPKDADQPEDDDQKNAEESENDEEQKDADRQENTDRKESAEEPEDADRKESAGQQAQPQQAAPAAAAPAAPAAPTSVITLINNFANKVLNLTLKDVKIDVSNTGRENHAGKAALSVQGEGNVEIELDGKNELKSGYYRAGLEKNNSTSAGTLTLKDNKEAGSGSLNAEGGALSAGIGACYEEGTKNIIITGGTVTATGGDGGAGIGGGDGGGAENITITGSTVTATGGSALGFGGAGIGGGGDGRNSDSNGKNITITGSTVTAKGGNGSAGIGGGVAGIGEAITITGSTVTATGGIGAAGIGGGIGGSGKAITITGGTANATGGEFGAGIGGGERCDGENITITGSTVTATGDRGGAGIGGGAGESNRGNGNNITITGSTVTAISNGCGQRGNGGGAGIGGGCNRNGSHITINGGTVTAEGGDHGAGIGGGAKGSGSNVTVSGAAQVTAIAGKGDRWDGAGATIGSGSGGSTKNPDGTFTPGSGQEIQANISGLITGYIHHIIYDPALVSEDNPDGILKEWWEPERPQPNPEDPNAPAEESNEVSLGTPGLHVETLEGDPLPFDARQQGSTLRVTSDNLAARLHGTRQALEALREQGVEQIQFVTSFKTTTLSVAELLAEGGSWFALEHNGLVSRRLSAAQAESLKCRMR